MRVGDSLGTTLCGRHSSLSLTRDGLGSSRSGRLDVETCRSRRWDHAPEPSHDTTCEGAGRLVCATATDARTLEFDEPPKWLVRAWSASAARCPRGLRQCTRSTVASDLRVSLLYERSRACCLALGVAAVLASCGRDGIRRSSPAADLPETEIVEFVMQSAVRTVRGGKRPGSELAAGDVVALRERASDYPGDIVADLDYLADLLNYTLDELAVERDAYVLRGEGRWAALHTLILRVLEDLELGRLRAAKSGADQLRRATDGLTLIHR